MSQYIHKQTGEKFNDETLVEYLKAQYTEDDHEEFINGIYDEVKIGEWTCSPGRVIRKNDPVWFDLSYQEELDYIVKENLEDYNISVIEEGSE